MPFEEYKTLEYRDEEPKVKENTHQMTSINDGDRFCRWRKIYQNQETWYNPMSSLHDLDMSYRKKLKKLDSKVKRLEIRKRKQRAIKKLWSSFEAITNSPEATPVVNFFQKSTPT